MEVPHCRFCGGEKARGRIDALYCNDSCKMKAYRWRKRRQEYVSKVCVQISNVAGYLDYPETFAFALEDIKEIKKYIDDQLKLRGITKVRVNGS
jgi:hypothetical protein